MRRVAEMSMIILFQKNIVL